MPQDLDFSQHFLRDIILSIFETCFYVLDGDHVLGGSVLGADDHAASSRADDFLCLITVFDKVPFFGQS